MSKDMKLIMESFRSFVKESTKEGSPCTERGVDAEHMGGVRDADGNCVPKKTQKENLNETNDWLFLIHQALGAQEDEKWGPPAKLAEKLLWLTPAQRKESLEPWLDDHHKDTLRDHISDSELEEELRSIATGVPHAIKKPVKKPADKPAIDIPLDQPPPTLK